MLFLGKKLISPRITVNTMDYRTIRPILVPIDDVTRLFPGNEFTESVLACRADTISSIADRLVGDDWPRETVIESIVATLAQHGDETIIYLCGYTLEINYHQVLLLTLFRGTNHIDSYREPLADAIMMSLCEKLQNCQCSACMPLIWCSVILLHDRGYASEVGRLVRRMAAKKADSLEYSEQPSGYPMSVSTVLAEECGGVVCGDNIHVNVTPVMVRMFNIPLQFGN